MYSYSEQIKNIDFLQEYNGYKNKKYLLYILTKDKSIPLSLSDNDRGSATIETAIALPIFLMAIISFYVFFSIYNFQNVMQNSMNQTAKSIARYSYVIDRIGEIDDISGMQEQLDVDSELLISGINTGYAWRKLATDEIKQYAEKTGVVGGFSGIQVISADIEKEDGKNYLIATYRLKINLLGQTYSYMKLANICYFHEWIGQSISKKEEKKVTIVYITKTGKVYHTSDNCSYIISDLKNIRYSQIGSMRNDDGKRYQACRKCIFGTPDQRELLYITYSGYLFHKDSHCTYIKKDAIPVDITKVGARVQCSRCRKGEKNGSH